MNINKVFLMGRLTADPELKMSASGIPNLRFTVAVNRRFAKQGEDRPSADFIRCTAFRQQAEFVSKYFKKGSLIIVFGSLQNDNYKDKDGIDRQSYSVIVDEVQFGEAKSSGSYEPAPVSHDFDPNQSRAEKSPVKPAESGANNEFFADIKDIEEELPF